MFYETGRQGKQKHLTISFEPLSQAVPEAITIPGILTIFFPRLTVWFVWS